MKSNQLSNKAIGSALWDVLIVGAGPAGSSAALILGRCRRRVLLCDSGTPRSWAAHRMHGFLTRDGMNLERFRESCREQLHAYPDVHSRLTTVNVIHKRSDGHFDVSFADRTQAVARTVLLASGVFDELPDIPNIADFFGVTAHPCPYCEGWEMQDLPIAIYGQGSRGFEMARAMTAWSADLLLCTDGPAELSASQQHALRANRIEVITARITDLIGEDGRLRWIRFANGSERERHALFFDTPCHPQSALAEQLGCDLARSGKVYCGEYEATSVSGVYAAGNILQDVQLSIVAAGDGARAAFGINRALTREDFGRQASLDLSGARASDMAHSG